MLRTVRKSSLRRGREGDRTMGLYVKEISRIPLLTVEEERELGYRAKAGDVDATQKLIEGNLRFVIKIAKKFVRRPDQLMDLINVGNVGLIEAARRFDPDMNVRFTSYAIWWIRQAIFHYLAESTHAFRISPKIANILYRTGKVLRDRVQSEYPDKQQLAKEVRVTVEELDAALKVLGGTVSLDEPINEEGDLLLQDRIEQSVMPSPEQQAVIHTVHDHLDRSLGHLKPIEQKVIRLRFGLNNSVPKTLREIGQQLDLSRERIRQIENAALHKLQQMYAGESLTNYLS